MVERTKTNREGDRYSQTIEIKLDKLTFEIRDADNQVRMAGKGKVKLEKAGPFQVLSLSDIQAGRSLDELEPVDETRAAVYRVVDGKLYVASNLDRERETERPGMDVYGLVTGTVEAAGSPVGDEGAVLGTWKLEVTIGDNTRDYELRIAKPDGQLKATLISPRSGEHACRSVQIKDGELVVEVEREVQGNPVIYVYKAKLSGQTLTGKVTVKGYEDQFSGQVKGTK